MKRLTVEKITVKVTPEKSYMLVMQCQSSAFAEGIYFLGGTPKGTSSHTSHNNLENFDFKQVCEGAVIIDARDFMLRDQINISLKGPMADCSLKQSHFKGFMEKAIPVKSLPEKMGGLDFLSLDLYTLFYRKQGAKIGRWLNNQIVWCP